MAVFQLWNDTAILYIYTPHRQDDADGELMYLLLVPTDIDLGYGCF